MFWLSMASSPRRAKQNGQFWRLFSYAVVLLHRIASGTSG
jgi:hypothetical protein